jgi:hypothetical protein
MCLNGTLVILMVMKFCRIIYDGLQYDPHSFLGGFFISSIMWMVVSYWNKKELSEDEIVENEMKKVRGDEVHRSVDDLMRDPSTLIKSFMDVMNQMKENSHDS